MERKGFQGSFPYLGVWKGEGLGIFRSPLTPPLHLCNFQVPRFWEILQKNIIKLLTPFPITCCLSNHCTFSLITLVWLQRKLSLRKSSPLLSQHMIWMNPQHSSQPVFPLFYQDHIQPIVVMCLLFMCPHHHIVVGINEAAASFSTSFLCCSGLLINVFAPSGMMFSLKFSFSKQEIEHCKISQLCLEFSNSTIFFL